MPNRLLIHRNNTKNAFLPELVAKAPVSRAATIQRRDWVVTHHLSAVVEAMLEFEILLVYLCRV
jgi:hypothetical protein